jgi:hypothetical protein
MEKRYELSPILKEYHVKTAGFDVRLPDGKIRSFTSATIVKEREDGMIELFNEHIHLGAFSKGQFQSFYPLSGSCEIKHIRFRRPQ